MSINNSHSARFQPPVDCGVPLPPKVGEAKPYKAKEDNSPLSDLSELFFDFIEIFTRR